MLLLMVGFGWRCTPLSRIWCSTAVIPSYFWLGIFLLSLRRSRLMRAPCCRSSCLVVKAVFTARVQYPCISRCAFVSSVKLNLSKNLLLLGTSSGLRSESSSIVWRRLSKLWLFVPQIAVALIVQGDVAVYPLWVSRLKDLGDKLFGPVSTIEVVTRHRQVEPLDIVKVGWYVPLREIPPSNLVLTVCKCAHWTCSPAE